jgi:hypothetical protein
MSLSDLLLRAALKKNLTQSKSKLLEMTAELGLDKSIKRILRLLLEQNRQAAGQAYSINRKSNKRFGRSIY